MNEGLEESMDEAAGEQPDASHPDGTHPDATRPDATHPDTTHPPEVLWLRWAYTLEFLIAVVAIITLWGEIGGQGHMDLIPWYTKLACVLGWCWCCVGFTAGIVEQKIFWTRRTVWWLSGIILLTVAMGAVTYYYHLHEEPDDGGDDTTASSVVSTVDVGRFTYDASYWES